MTPDQQAQAVEAALLAAGRALSVDELVTLFDDEAPPPGRRDILDSIASLRERWEGRGLEIAEVASGFRMQVRASHSRRMARLWAERPPRYSRALLETLSLIAYRQPITRGQIEDVRGVGVSTSIIKTLIEREWIRVVGHREIPGRPALYGTTKAFLDGFNLKSLDDLPPLMEMKDVDGPMPDLFPPVPSSRGRGPALTVAGAVADGPAAERPLPAWASPGEGEAAG